MAYLGKTPSQAVRSRFYFTASGGETSLAPAQVTGLSFTDANYVDVSLNGVALVSGTDYTATPSTNTISGLAALTASDVVEIVVYDVFSVFGGSVNGDFNISGGDLTLGDDDKAIFGAGSDLQIYHDTTANHSYIQESGSGDLIIQGNNVRLENTSGNYYVRTFSGGAVQLYHNNSEKLATTSTGVDVTGELQCDSLDVDGAANINSGTTDNALTVVSTDAGVNITLTDNTTSMAVGNSAGTFQLYGDTSSYPKLISASNSAVVINEDSNDTDFRVESDSSTLGHVATHGLFLEASSGKVGIAEDSPSDYYADTLVVKAADESGITIATADTYGHRNLLAFANDDSGTERYAGYLAYDHGNDSMQFGTGATEAMRIDSSGLVGIGNSIPNSFNAGANNLVVGSGSGSEGITIYGGAESNIFFADGTASADNLRGRIEYSHIAENMKFYVNNGLAALLDSNAQFMIGTSTAAGQFTVTDSDATAVIDRIGTNVAGLYTGSGDDLTVGTADFKQAIRIKNVSGNVGIGSTAPINTLHVEGDGLRLVNSSDTDALHLFAYDNNHATAFYYNASGSNTVAFHSADNSFFNPSNSDRGLLIGKTVSNTANAGHELKKEGFLGVTRDNGTPVQIRRNGNDGPLINFNQAGTIEGDISVSGSTVSYNGGHLSRWSQATDGNRITGLVKGTVMTNLDQMAVWHHEAQAATYYTEDDELPDGVSVGDEKTPAVAAYDEDNEQLNCMAVSSVEGDANVAGVFVNWDDDDTDFTADMNIAMTGDMVIRIASGTTVARGDLLMSAGDGTAKPQGDDIVRSKTIAKVTSTTVSHTYDDGTYLVPCVLMAC